MLKEKNVMLDELKDNLYKAQDKMKKFADRRRKEVHYKVSDRVFLKMQFSQFMSLIGILNEKLSPNFYRSYKLIEKIGTTTYLLLLPFIAKIHLVFHVS